jgi:glycosyltransferase involved in cell wall biosynthesis
MSQQKVSVVIASCFLVPERLKYLTLTVARLKEKLLKFYNDDRNCFEIIVCVDKSEDDIRHLEVDKVYYHKKGLGHSFNMGIELASNELILQIEDDWLVNHREWDLDMIYNVLQKSSTNAIFKVYPEPSSKIYKCDSENKVIYNGTMHPVYSNWPHFKLKSAFTGKYVENRAPPLVEVNMVEQYHRNRWDAYHISCYFQHIGYRSIREGQ